MINTIIIPIDLTSDDYNVLQYGVGLARNFGSRILLIHTYTLPQTAHYGAGPDGFVTYLSEQDLAEDNEFQEENIKELLDGVPSLETIEHEFVVRQGPVPEVVQHEVVQAIRREGRGRQLIVMGTHGASGVGEILGTIAEKVTRDATCPVLVVPGNREYQPIESICLALDDEHEVVESYDPVIEIIKAYRSTVYPIHVTSERGGADDGVYFTFYQRLQRERIVSPKSIRTILADDVEQGIEDFLHRHDIDLLVLIFREHGFFKRLFNPGVRIKMLYHSDVPVLVLK